MESGLSMPRNEFTEEVHNLLRKTTYPSIINLKLEMEVGRISIVICRLEFKARVKDP